MKILTAIYGHPEFYPPTLNAIRELAANNEKVIVLGRNVRKSEWAYPGNVEVDLTGEFMPVKKVQESSLFRKVVFFIQYTIHFYKLIKKNRPVWVICYDAIPLLSFSIVRRFLKNPPKIWYHNHDVIKPDEIQKYSISWWAMVSEKKFFPKLDIFSLPSNERQEYFPMDQLKGKYFHLPNFPAVAFYKPFKVNTSINDAIRLIYQGTIGDDHGIEEIMRYMKNSRHKIQLILVGNIDDDYKAKLESLRKELQLEQVVEILKPVSYAQLPAITATAHVGIAINVPNDIMYATGGTASNKIYEYSAVGLPIFYFDNEHYNQYLAPYKWAIPTNLDAAQLEKKIDFIRNHYHELSSAALNDFEEELNFEKSFAPILQYLDIRKPLIKFITL